MDQDQDAQTAEEAELDELERIGARLEKVYEKFPQRPGEDPDDYRDRIRSRVLASGRSEAHSTGYSLDDLFAAIDGHQLTLTRSCTTRDKWVAYNNSATGRGSTPADAFATFWIGSQSDSSRIGTIQV